MRAIGRWGVAFLAVIAAVAVPVWLCEALILPHVIKDPGVRWGVATAPGLAVATFVGLWAYDYVKRATDDKSAEHDESPAGGTPRPASTGRGTTKNSIKGGLFTGGPVFQGRDITYNADPAPPRKAERGGQAEQGER
jgi:hypothetical protein